MSTPRLVRNPIVNRSRVDEETDYLEATFGAMTSPFVRELKESTTLVLDMDKPAG